MAVSLRRRSILHFSTGAVLVAQAALAAVRTTAGIQGSGFQLFAAIGPITAVGSGSISVGGIDYSTAAAWIDVNLWHPTPVLGEPIEVDWGTR